MTIKANVQFDSFVDFAQKSMEAGSSKAVARADAVVPGKDGGYATRTIVAAPDKAFKISRSITDKAKNDVARTLFQKSVIDMFGGEDKIPESVKDAMLLKDYGAGKPLTARRIMAVKQAIELAMDPVPKMTHALALEAVTSGLQHVNAMHQARGIPGINLTEQQMSEAANLVETHGKGLSEKAVKVLANFTLNLIACDTTAQLDHGAIVKRYANDVSKWRNFNLGDSRYAAVDAKVQEHAQSMLDEYLGDVKASQFNGDSLHSSFVKDAPRASFTINGHVFLHGTCTGDDIINAFKGAVGHDRPKCRKALSSFFCQTMGGTVIGLSQENKLSPTVGLPKGIDLGKVKGAGMFIPSAFGRYGDPFYKIPKTQVNDSHYTLDVAPDGKSAKISIETKGDIAFALDAVSTGFNNSVGTFTWKQDFVFDLSGDTPKIVAAHVGQTFEA